MINLRPFRERVNEKFSHTIYQRAEFRICVTLLYSGTQQTQEIVIPFSYLGIPTMAHIPNMAQW